MPPRQCDFPGCANRGQYSDKQTDRRLCKAHRPLREIPGWRDVYCQLCGFGPRTTLTRHVNRFHDGKAAYIRQFGPLSLVSEDFRHNRRILFDQQTEATMGALRRRQKTCNRGHRYTAKNTYTLERRNGYIQRQCRRCIQDRNRRPQRRQKCKECGKSFQPQRSTRLFCSKWCRRRAWYRGKMNQRSPRQCAICGQEFQPSRVDQRLCSPECRRRAHAAVCRAYDRTKRAERKRQAAA